MKIWYFHHYATPYEIHGLHRPFEFGSYLNRQGDEVTVFTSSYLHYSGENMIKGKEKFLTKKYDGVNAVFVKTLGYKNLKINRVFNMVQFALKLFSVSKEIIRASGKPDVIIASSPHPLTMLSGLKMSKKLGIPCICEVRDFWPEVFFLGGAAKENSIMGRLLLRTERKIYEKADSLVFLKEGDHTYITDRKWDVENGGKTDMSKCYYVNNGVDVDLFNKRISEHSIEDADLKSNKFKIIYCGTIRPVNNIGMLLDVAKKLDCNSEILIYGTGNCVKELQSRMADENITNVKLKGYVDNKYIPYILSNASLNILNYSGSSYNWSRGNSSNKLFEYLASGKPVVSTVKMGYDIIERYKCGYSVEECTAENVVGIIERIRNLSAEEYSEMCKNAKKAANDFDIPKLAEKYRNILKQTINKFHKTQENLK